MARPESIEALNGHWWYRLIKVLYLIMCLGIIMVGLLVIYSGPSNAVDYQKSTITCNNGNSSNLAQLQYLIGSPSDDELWNSNLGFVPDIPDQILNNLNYDFQAFCANALPLTQAEIDALNGKQVSSQSVVATTTLVAKTTGFVPADIPSQKNFSLSVTTKEFTWMRAWYVLIWLVVSVLLFQLIRRTFYYIVIGRFFPAKWK